jgi:hypothetical protein
MMVIPRRCVEARNGKSAVSLGSTTINRSEFARPVALDCVLARFARIPE